MKNYSLFVFLCFCFLGKAQDTTRTISVSFKAGLIFTRFESSLGIGTRNERYNEWNLELGIEENKFGFGLSTRYIAARGFIPNIIFKPSPYPSFNRNTVKKGDLIYRRQYFENFSFLINKRSWLKNRHRLDFALGLQLRKGAVEYFDYFFGIETRVTFALLDKYGLLSRIGYTYMINKHFSVSTNIEYSRFKMKPVDFWDFNILAGVRF